VVQPTTLIGTDELTALRTAYEAEGARVAFVPTMGALHEGHLSLVATARQRADRVIASIFVNPLQFGPSEDLARYPRTLKADLDLLATLEVEAVFVPNAAMMYPDGFQTYVHNKEMAQSMDGISRKGHFEGVLTVVLKLLNLVRPHVAIFGKKDYQQWRLIERMVRDLAVPVEVVGAETLREADGLAMSSRNRYLSDTERPVATRLHQGLTTAKAAYDGGAREAPALIEAFQKVAGAVQGLAIEYVEVRERTQLTPVTGTIERPVVMLVAAKLGTTRLIDNLEIG
jgi:pantoate--beta-alanine ligase